MPMRAPKGRGIRNTKSMRGAFLGNPTNLSVQKDLNKHEMGAS